MGLRLGSGIKKIFINAETPTEEHHQTSDTEEIFSCLPTEIDQRLSLFLVRQIPGILRAKNKARSQLLHLTTESSLSNQATLPIRNMEWLSTSVQQVSSEICWI